MRAKRKLIISILSIMFVLLAVVATITITFALSQQNITTSLEIGYVVEDIDGSVYATYTIGTETKYLTPDADADHKSEDGKSLVFLAQDDGPAGNLQFPDEALALTSKNDNIVIKYTYSNTGDRHYMASMSLDDDIIRDNMNVEYSINGVDYSYNRYAVVVPANSTDKSYWIRISIKDVAKNASFSGSFNWVLTGCDEQDVAYKSLEALDYIADEDTGTYGVSYNGNTFGLDDGKLIVPDNVNGDPVTTITQSNADNTEQVTSVYIPESVETIGSSAFEGYTTLETVTFEQNETAGSASVQTVTGLQTIGSSAFCGCERLTQITLPNTLKTIGARAFAQANLSEIIIPDSVTEIGENAFESNYDLRSIILGNGLTTIKKCAFMTYSESVDTLIIPDNITTIEADAFSYCDIVNLTLGKGLTSIAVSAFKGCALTNISMGLVSLPKLNTCSAFNNLTINTLILDCETPTGDDMSLYSIFANSTIKNIKAINGEFYCNVVNEVNFETLIISESVNHVSFRLSNRFSYLYFTKTEIEGNLNWTAHAAYPIYDGQGNLVETGTSSCSLEFSYSNYEYNTSQIMSLNLLLGIDDDTADVYMSRDK